MPTLGILGGGQLGRLLAMEARARGVRTIVRTDEPPGGPASQVADGELTGPYDDDALNDRLAAGVDAVTSEFENLPRALLDRVAQRVPVRPSGHSVWTCQHREREKRFLATEGLPHAVFEVVTSAKETAAAVADMWEHSDRVVLKTAAFGYDGKGQIVLGPHPTRDEAEAAWHRLGTERAVVEAFVRFEREISIVGARGEDGSWRAFAPGENVHRDGILDHTLAPARITASTAAEADRLARRVADALGHVGTIGVELFVLPDGGLVVNEIAPRPHNSGHHTIDACVTSQFGLQLTAALGDPVSGCDVTQRAPAVMLNLLGDRWAHGEPDWALVEGMAGVSLHRYGKAEARPGRKMAHLTVLGTEGEPAEALLARALGLREQMTRRPAQ